MPELADSIVSRPLAELLAAGPSWTLQERLALAERMALAVQTLHSRDRPTGPLMRPRSRSMSSLRPKIGRPPDRAASAANIPIRSSARPSWP